MAYSNLAQLRMLASEFKAVVRWGTKAIELARRLGDREAEMHALNNVGTALASAGHMTEGCTRLTQSLDLALAEDAHEHAARAFTNLGSIHILNWSLSEADRHLKAGITYCADRDLDTWRRYMSAWLARSLAGQGQYAAGGTAPRRCPASSARVADQPGQRPACGRRDRSQARRRRQRGPGRGPGDRRPDGGGPASGASSRGARRGGVDRRAARRPGDRDRPGLGRRRRASASLGTRRAQLVAAPGRGAPAGPDAPGAAVRADAGGRARRGRRRVGRPGLPAVVRLRAGVFPELGDAQRCLDLLGPLDVPAVRHAVLRDRRARGLPVPRGPRPASRASPAGLTARETEVLELLADGLSYAEVAERLVLSEKTVGHHVSAVLRKLREPTRSRAVATAQRLGVISPR